MNKSFATAIGLAAALGTSGVLAAEVETVTLNGDTVHVVKDIPAELIGTYLYEKEGEPIVELGGGNKGVFQPHGVPGIPIDYWLLADEQGVPVKQTGEGNPNYRYTVVVKYGPGGGGNYPEGNYDAFYWTMDVEGGCANILGERFKCN